MIVGRLPHAHHRIQVCLLRQHRQCLVDQLAIDHHRVAEQQHDVFQSLLACVGVLGGVLDHLTMIDMIAAQLLGADNDLTPQLASDGHDLRRVGRDIGARHARRLARGLDRIGDERLPAQRQDVLVADRFAARSRSNDGNVHAMAPGGRAARRWEKNRQPGRWPRSRSICSSTSIAPWPISTYKVEVSLRATRGWNL